MDFDQSCLWRETSFESFLPSSFSQQQLGGTLDGSPSFTANNDNPTTVRKLNHNAKERERRQKINGLFSSLRSLLPASHQVKKLTTPAIVSKVLKYIPELQQQVEAMVQKKEVLSRIPGPGKQKKSVTGGCTAANISANRLSDTEVMLQLSTYKVHKTSLSDILVKLEEDGFLLINASSFESFEGRVFYNLHLQVDRNCRSEVQALSKKLLPLLQKEEGFP
ncbi:hypothetical protein SLE2022_134850 [Rubroshorea leprosula]